MCKASIHTFFRLSPSDVIAKSVGQYAQEMESEQRKRGGAIDRGRRRDRGWIQNDVGTTKSVVIRVAGAMKACFERIVKSIPMAEQ